MLTPIVTETARLSPHNRELRPRRNGLRLVPGPVPAAQAEDRLPARWAEAVAERQDRAAA